MAEIGRSASKKTLTLSVKDKVELRGVYMSWVKNGGIFVPDMTGYALGDEVFVLLGLMEEPEKIPIAGKVVWVAAEGVKHPHKPGIGVQFLDPDNPARRKIEACLANIRQFNNTYTM